MWALSLWAESHNYLDAEWLGFHCATTGTLLVTNLASVFAVITGKPLKPLKITKNQNSKLGYNRQGGEFRQIKLVNFSQSLVTLVGKLNLVGFFSGRMPLKQSEISNLIQQASMLNRSSGSKRCSIFWRDFSRFIIRLQCSRSSRFNGWLL